jgi:WD40 repeat protein
VSVDDRRALFLYGKGLMELWDLEGDRKLHTLGSEQDYWSMVAMTPDGKRALTGDNSGRVRLWDLEKGEQLLPNNVGEAHCVALSRDARLALTGHFGLVVLHDVRSGQVIKALREKHGPVFAAAFSPDGSRFAYGDTHGNLHVRQTETTELLWSQPAHAHFLRALVFSADGTRLYSGGGHSISTTISEEVGAIRIWDAASGKSVGKLTGHSAAVQCLALSPDGTRLFSGAGSGDRKDCTVRLWDLASSNELRIFDDHKNPVIGVCFAPDGKRFVSASHGQTFLWDLEAPPTKQRRQLTVQGTRALSFVDERQLVTVENDRQLVVISADGDVISGRFMPHLVNGLALSKDGKYLATANSNGTGYVLRLPLRGR